MNMEQDLHRQKGAYCMYISELHERRFYVHVLSVCQLVCLCVKQAQESLAAAMSLNSVCHKHYCLCDFKLQLATCNFQLQHATCKM